MVELRLRVPVRARRHATDDATPAASPPPSCSPPRCSPAPSTRDRVAIDDELAGGRRGPGRLASIPSGCRSAAPGSPPGCRRCSRCSPTSSPRATHPDAEVLRERERLVERITVARAQPRTIAREALQRKRFGNHPIAREMPTGPDVAAVEPADVARAAGRPALVPRRRDPHPRRRPRPGRRRSRSVEQPSAAGRPAHAARELTAPPPIDAGEPASWCTGPGRCSRSCGCPRRRCPASTRATPRCSWRTSCSAATSPRAGWRTSARTRATPTARTRASSSCPGGAVLSVETDVASDVTAAALLETRYELGRMAAVPPTAEEIDAARRYAVGLAADLAGQPGRLRLHVAALAARRRRRGAGCATTRRALEAVTPERGRRRGAASSSRRARSPG